MKAEKVLGVVACAVACVASVNAFADQIAWFNGNVGSTTTSGISTPTSASWNATLPDGVTLAEGSITLDNDSSTALVLTPADSSEPALSDQVVTISSTAVLTPSDASDLGDVEGAKAGFAVGVSNNGVDTNFYGYASGLTAGSRWVKLSGTVPQGENASTTFSIVLDYRTDKKNVKFYLGDTQLTDASDSAVKEWAIDSLAASLSNVAAYGSGSLSALSATCEKAVVAIGTVKYGSVADALADNGTSGASATIKYVNSDGTPGSVTAANGLDAATCVALGVDATAQSAVVRFVPADSDTDANNVTLKVGSDNVDTGLYVTYTIGGDGSGTQTTNDGTVKIPTTTGVYTITPTSVSTTAN